MPIASKYNLWSRSDHGAALLFNGLSGALVELDADEEPRIRALLAAPDEVCPDDEDLAALAEAGFLVVSHDEEFTRLEARARRGRSGQHGTLELVVSPTWVCNFRCDYGYVDQRSGVMAAETELAIEQFAARGLEEHDLVELSRYGGEVFRAECRECEHLCLYMGGSPLEPSRAA